MCDRLLTTIELVFYPEYRNDRLRFGKPKERILLDRRRALSVFEPGHLFGYLRWSSNEFGTEVWVLVVGQSAGPGETITRLQGVKPGAVILLHVSGAARVRKMLAHLDTLEARGFTPHKISPAYFRHLHNRILTRCDFRPYSETQSRAIQAARRVLR
ncbi:hypothetical protein IWQ55_000788 [Labrenzia sp. EL_208]|nr:hypothetical protein [Labrenzia sp. EL_132]MBG6211002.1 hypothetical protein [Labrenzia sp. EL_126]MBG6227590.1 hypothetical protein [Labrenzia sp. EL_208]